MGDFIVSHIRCTKTQIRKEKNQGKDLLCVNCIQQATTTTAKPSTLHLNYSADDDAMILQIFDEFGRIGFKTVTRQTDCLQQECVVAAILLQSIGWNDNSKENRMDIRIDFSISTACSPNTAGDGPPDSAWLYKDMYKIRKSDVDNVSTSMMM